MDIRSFFAGKREINCVFLGGSITEGAHASIYPNCYAAQVGRWLAEQFAPDTVFTVHNKGVGGTPSQYGALRLARDVIAKKPDLVFVEFAVNDGGSDTRLYMESIVRHLQQTCDPYIIFLYTANENYTVDASYHRALAAYYNLPEIDLQAALKKALDGKNAREEGYMTDAVHPSDKGHAVYADEIIRCVAQGDCFRRAQKKERTVPGSGAWETVFLPSTDPSVSRTGDWETNTENPDRPRAKSKSTGARLHFSFEGEVLAIEHGLHTASCMYELRIDGKEPILLHPVYDDIATYQLVIGYATVDLAPGHHEVDILTLPSTNPNYTGSETLFYNFIIGKRPR